MRVTFLIAVLERGKKITNYMAALFHRTKKSNKRSYATPNSSAVNYFAGTQRNQNIIGQGLSRIQNHTVI